MGTIRKCRIEVGIYSVNRFLNCWFIEKCLCSSRNSLRGCSASIKKFYEFMSEKGFVTKEDYKSLCRNIKDDMNDYLERMDAYNNGTFYDIF